MPRNGSGVYSLPNPPFVADSVIASATMNGQFADLVSDANGARPVTAGGTGSTNATAARTALGANTETQINAATDADFTDDDMLTARDGTSGGLLKRSWANVKALLKTVNDSLYATAAQGTLATNAMPKAGGIFTGAVSGPTPSVGDSTTKLATTAFVATAAIGIGQTWQDVKASRSANTSFQNTTGKPIMVSLSCFGTSVNYGFNVSSDNVTFIETASGSGATEIPFGAVVPPGHFYKLRTSGSATIDRWTELR